MTKASHITFHIHTYANGVKKNSNHVIKILSIYVSVRYISGRSLKYLITNVPEKYSQCKIDRLSTNTLPWMYTQIYRQ